MVMGDLIESLARGNVPEVKAVLATVIVAVGVYQVTLMAIGYGKLRVPVLSAASAALAHRLIGPAIVAVALAVATACLAEYGLEAEDGADILHAVAGIGVLAALVVKVLIIRRFHGLSRALPFLGVSVLALFALVWATSAPNVIGADG